MVELSARRGQLALRATFAASYGFAQVTSLAYPQAASAFANVTIKTVLQEEGYYFAQGLLAFATVEAELGDVRLTLDGRSQSFWSFNSDDERQSTIQNNFSLHDTRLFLSVVASWQPLGGPVRLAFEFDDDARESGLLGDQVRSDERRGIGSVILVF